MGRTIVVACDHAGFEIKESVINAIYKAGCAVIDVGTFSNERVDFPDFALLGAEKILNGQSEKGIFICGSGIGICLAANKIPGIYAGVCHDIYSAHQAVEHDNINVLCLGSRVIGSEVASDLVTCFLGASFNNRPNQIRRVEKILKIEKGDYYMTNTVRRISDAGQSIWYDNIQRKYLKDGTYEEMIHRGEIRGMTSNPSIFHNAICNSNDYDNALVPMAIAGAAPDVIFTQLSVEDIRSAADLFRNLYIESKGLDGYISMEVNPTIAHDPTSTIEEAKRLWTLVNRPNLMIKIPATKESLPVIRELIAFGININATLLFSEERYAEIADAYISGLEDRLAQGKSIENIYSVASIFVSRIDTKVDKMLDAILEKNHGEGTQDIAELKGKSGIANAQKIYRRFQHIFADTRFMKLKNSGAKVQRPLWASTSSKNPNYPDTIYANALIGTDTVDTVPPATLKAILDHGASAKTLPVSDETIDTVFTKLKNVGINFDEVTTQLENEGVNSFEKAFTEMLADIDRRSKAIRSNMGPLYNAMLENYQKVEKDSYVQRMFAKDPTLWTFNNQDFAEIRNRLGWLDAFTTSAKSIPDYKKIYNGLKEENFKKILLLGMGGSSLAPEVMAKTFQNNSGLKLTIVDSTDPAQVKAADESHDPSETVYIVSSKSGGTAEVRAYLDYFYKRATEVLGDKAGMHFIAITDPGTGLERTAHELKFREIVLADPSVGGRFSALTAFGMLPAVLMGLDPETIISKAMRIANNCAPSSPIIRNEGVALGVYLGTAALQKHDKLTIINDPEFSSFGSWLEQLIAESSGKDGKGIIPIDMEANLDPKEYAGDRAFVYINYSGEKAEFAKKLTESGQPVFTIKVNDLYGLFAEFYRWEIAISIACALLQVNAFNQPNVQDSKTRTVAKVNDYKEKGKLTSPEYVWEKNGVKAYFTFECPDMMSAQSPAEFLKAFENLAKSGEDFIAINAYLPRNDEMSDSLQKVRSNILERTNCATTLGFGPRFQHSTGQLHKGGKNNGLFIQLVGNNSFDFDIPNEGLTFGILERAQALGDFEALLANERRAVRIDLGNHSPEVLIG